MMVHGFKEMRWRSINAAFQMVSFIGHFFPQDNQQGLMGGAKGEEGKAITTMIMAPEMAEALLMMMHTAEGDTKEEDGAGHLAADIVASPSPPSPYARIEELNTCMFIY